MESPACNRVFSGIQSLVACRAQYDANRLLDAKKTLQRAIHCSPWDTTLAFNLAVVMQVTFFRLVRLWRKEILGLPLPPFPHPPHYSYICAHTDRVSALEWTQFV